MEDILQSYIEEFKKLKSQSDKKKDYQTVYNCLCTLMGLETNIYQTKLKAEYEEIMKEQAKETENETENETEKEEKQTTEPTDGVLEGTIA